MHACLQEDMGGEEMNAQLFKNMQESLVDIVQVVCFVRVMIHVYILRLRDHA